MRRTFIALLLIGSTLHTCTAAHAGGVTRVRVVYRHRICGTSANLSPVVGGQGSQSFADEQSSIVPGIVAAVISGLLSGDRRVATPPATVDLTPVSESLKRVEDKMTLLDEALKDYTKRAVESQQDFDRRLKDLDAKVDANKVELKSKIEGLGTKIDANQAALMEKLEKIAKGQGGAAGSSTTTGVTETKDP